MAKRKILNRRSSRSSRYTGSDILDPDTNVIDNAYPCWWKDLENNTMVRPSINYSMLNETSPHLDPSSRIETSKIVNEWWKALDASESSTGSEHRVEKGASKLRIATSESEEELPVKKRKLPLRLKAKIQQNNAFFNILNDSKNSSKKISTPDTKNKKNLITNSDSSSKTVINEEQLTNTKDSRSNQSSNLNNILKSKPKIFKKNYKNQHKNIFVDALQDNEFEASPQKGSSINKSQKVNEKNSSVTIGPDNQSESMDSASFLHGVHDFSHLPLPKAQSTTIEGSSSHNGTKNSSSDAEYEIMKPKPKLLRHPTKSIKKTVLENTSANEETDKGTKTGNLRSIVDNIEKSKLSKRRTRSTKRNVFEDIFAAEESVIQTDKSKLTSVESTEIFKQSSIFLSNDLPESFRKSQENVVSEDEKNDAGEKMITSRSKEKRKSVISGVENIKESIKDRSLSENIATTNDKSDVLSTQKKYNLRKLTDMDASARNESLTSPGSTIIKRKNVRQKSIRNQDGINDKNDENILNVTGVDESAAKGSNDKEVSNELQNTNGKQDSISLARSGVDVISSSHRKKHDSTMNRSRSLSKTDKSTSSVKKQSINRKISNIIDEDVRDAGKKDSYIVHNEDTSTLRRRSINVSSGSNRNKLKETENRSRSSHRTSNLTSMESIGNMPIHERTDTWNVSKKNIKEVEAISKDSLFSVDKEMLGKSQHAEDSDVFPKKSLPNDLPPSKTKKSGNVRNSSRLSSRTGNSTSFARKIDGTDRNTLNVYDKTAKDVRDLDGTGDSNNEELVNKVSRSVHSRSVANVSSSSSEQERNDKVYANRVSSKSRASNLASFGTIGDTHTNSAVVNDKNVREIQDEVTSGSDDVLSNRIHRLSENYTANVTLNTDSKERDRTENRGKSSFTEKRSEKINTNTIEVVDDKNVKNVEDKVLSDSTDEELVHNEPRLSRRKSSANASSNLNGKKCERTENRIMVSPRISNLVPLVKVVRINITMPPSVDNKDGRETKKEELIGVGNEAISDKLRYSDKEQKNISRSPATNTSYNNNRGERSTRENRGRSSFRTSNRISSAKRVENTDANSLNYTDKEQKNISRSPATNTSYNNNRGERSTRENRGRSSFRTSNRISSAKRVENTDANSLNVDDKNEREVQDEEPLVNSIQRLSESLATGVSSNFHRNERSDTANHRGKISSRASNPVSMEILEDVNSNNPNVDGKSLMEREDEVGNKLENVSKKQGNVSVKKFAVNRKTGKGNASNISERNAREREDGISEIFANEETSNLFRELFESNVTSALKPKRQTSIRSFFNFDESEVNKSEQIRMELDKVKRQEMNCINANVQQQRTQPSSTVRTNINERRKLMSKSRKKPIIPKQVHKAYLVNGQVYRVPRLPRPKEWVTDRLYNYLWKLMEPKYKLETRVISEKFICRVSAVTTHIAKKKHYQNYKNELYALMKEMARLGIVRTRNDFYNFCHDFFPYELRAKMVPILLPGNKRNIPYDPSTLHEPILNS